MTNYFDLFIRYITYLHFIEDFSLGFYLVLFVNIFFFLFILFDCVSMCQNIYLSHEGVPLHRK